MLINLSCWSSSNSSSGPNLMVTMAKVAIGKEAEKKKKKEEESLLNKLLLDFV